MVNRRAEFAGFGWSRGGRRRSGAFLMACGGAVACGGGGDSPVAPPPPTSGTVLVHVAGQAVPAGPATTGGLRVFVRRDAAPGTDYAVALDPSGAFQLDATVPGLDGDSVTLAVDVAAGATARTVRPVVVRATRATLPGSLRPLLVPRAVALPAAGSYAGTTLPVSLRDAFTPVCTTFSNPNCNSFFPQDWLNGVALWPAASLPVPLAFDRGGAAGAITAADSAAFWTIVRQMERDLGRPLFRPATLTDLTALDSKGYSAGAVLVSLDPTLGPTGGYTNWVSSLDLGITAARSRFGAGALLSSSPLVTHELLHALGFHHTCAWTTVMGGYGCGSAGGATVGDAAGFALAYQVRTAQLGGAPTTGLAAARAGELRLELGVLASRDVPDAVQGAAVGVRVSRGVVRETGAW